MKVFLFGAVASANEKQMNKYDVYKRILTESVKNIELTTPVDILNYKNKCIAENPKKSQFEIDKMMVDYDLQQVRESDLVVCDISMVSTGMGIELGVAHENNKPAIFCHEENANISDMIFGSFPNSKYIPYQDLNDLENKLKSELQNIKKV